MSQLLIPKELAEQIDSLLWHASWAAGKIDVECKRFRSFPREVEALGEKREELNAAQLAIRQLILEAENDAHIA